MKKKLLCVVLTGLCMASLIACGKSERDQAAEYYQDELGFSEEEAEELADAFYGDESGQTGSSQDAGSETEEDVSTVEFERYPADPSWGNYTISDKVIQVDDVMYIAGCTLDEAIQKIADSDVDYTYEYDPNAEVHPKTDESLTIYRGGQEWVTILYLNPYDEWRPAGESVVVGYELSDMAYEYGYFINGMSYQDILAMRDTDIEDLFADYTKSYSGLEYAMNKAVDAEWTGYDINRMFQYSFEYDRDTYYITKMRIDTGGCSTWSEIDYNQIMHQVTDLDCLDEAAMEALKEEAVTVYLEDYWNQQVFHNTSAECIGYFVGSKSSFYGYEFIIIMKGSDGKYYDDLVYINDYRDGRIEVASVEYYISAQFHNETLEDYMEYYGLTEEDIHFFE